MLFKLLTVALFVSMIEHCANVPGFGGNDLMWRMIRRDGGDCGKITYVDGEVMTKLGVSRRGPNDDGHSKKGVAQIGHSVVLGVYSVGLVIYVLPGSVISDEKAIDLVLALDSFIGGDCAIVFGVWRCVLNIEYEWFVGIVHDVREGGNGGVED